MKKNKLILLSLGTAVSAFPAIFSVSANTNNETDERKEKLNKNSNIEMNDKALDSMRNLFMPYYKKLGISSWDRTFSSSDIDMTSPYNRAGVLEINNSDMPYMLSSKPNFKINYFKKPVKDLRELHGYAVSSIIGSDVGINPDANIFYASTKNNGQESYAVHINNVLNWYKSNNVNIINISIGPKIDHISYDLKKVITNIDSATHKELINLDENDVDDWGISKFTGADYYNSINLLHDPDNFPRLIEKYKKIIILEEFFKEVNAAKNNHIFFSAIDKFAKENGTIFVMSSSNQNAVQDDFLPFYKRSLYKYLLDLINNYEHLKKEITCIHSYFKDEKYMRLLRMKIKDIYRKLGDIPRDYPAELAEVINQITYIYNHNENISKIINRYHVIHKYINDSFAADFDSLYYSKPADNIIYVGAVDYNNKPTEFSYFMNNNSNMPIISAYGNYMYEDDNIISRKIGFDETRKTKTFKIISNSTEDEEFKAFLTELEQFSGTSMSAPMITGLLSLIQTKFQKKLSLTEAKLLLAASSNYANTTIEKIYTSDLDYDINKEFWKENHSKNKTGFGIPKYFIIKKLLFGNKISSYNNKNEKLSSLLGTGYNDFSISHFVDLSNQNKSEHIEYTASFNNIDWKTLLNSYFIRWAENNDEKTIISALSSYIEKRATTEPKSFISNLNNIVDISTELHLEDNTNKNISRYKSSASKDGSVERVYYGKYPNKTYKSLNTNVYFSQFDALSRITDEAISNHVFNYNSFLWIKKDYDSHYVKSVVQKFYKKFMDDVLDLKYILKVNE
ncbi:S8 family serine peptidase [Mycoplasma sp. Z631]|uniref:S8 family serine peptidase n=1 Tax=Mycoplasma sp. Z631 TaxID=3401685 RepID=UPI003AABC778